MGVKSSVVSGSRVTSPFVGSGVLVGMCSLSLGPTFQWIFLVSFSV